MRFRGSADRVDRAGDAIVVVDYKTGSTRHVQRPRRGRPHRRRHEAAASGLRVCGARRARRARRTGLRRVLVPPQGPRQADRRTADRAGARHLRRDARGHRGRHRRRAVPAPAAGGRRLGRLHRVCRTAIPDGLGAKEHRDRWERKRHDPRLAAYLALVDRRRAPRLPPTPQDRRRHDAATELTDAAARRQITERLDRTLFVEAGAGSGKTRSLVDRVVATVLTQDSAVPLRHIAAVTFTEKAGAELRDRLRVAFEDELAAATRLRRAQRAAEALDDLDAAAIGTLHSFAQRILGEHPVEAGLPPLIEVLDEVASGVAFDNRWIALRAELLDDADLAPALLLAMAAGMKLDDLRSMARAFTNDWDLLEAAGPRRAGRPSCRRWT